MQITRQTDYAIRCILFLAKEPERIFNVKEIARLQLIPGSFLAKILQKLVKAGIVKSSKGQQGGFKLAKRPEEISLLDVIEVIEGSVAMNICAVDKKMCSLSDTCSVHPVWVEIREVVGKRLKQCTFAELVSK